MGKLVQSVKQDYALLCHEMNAIKGALAAFSAAYGKLSQNPGKRSVASRAQIAAAQRARWAKAEGNLVRSEERRVGKEC